MKTLDGYIRVQDLLPNDTYSGDQNGQPVDTRGLVAAAGSVILTTVPLDGTTITIGNKTYIYKDTLSTGPSVANEVLIGVNVAATRTNLKKAINDEGTAGTHYGTGTVRNGTVSAGTIASATIPLTARASGAAGNEIPLSSTSVETDNSVVAFSGGRDGEQFDGALVRVAVGDISGTPDSLTVAIYESDTADFASSSVAAGGVAQTMVANSSYSFEIERSKKFMRAVADFTGGTSPGAGIYAMAVLHNFAKPLPIV